MRKLRLGMAALCFAGTAANAQVLVQSVKVTVGSATSTAVYCSTSLACGTFGSGNVEVWALPVGGQLVNPGQTLVLTQTGVLSGVGGNFDTSDRVRSNQNGFLGPYITDCEPSDPCTVTVEINGVQVYQSAAGDAINAFNNDNEVNEASPFALVASKPNYTLKLGYADNAHTAGGGFPSPWRGTATYFIGDVAGAIYDAGALLITGVQTVSGCTLTQGGYKNHFNSKVLNLPLPNLKLGNVSYTNLQIDSIIQNNAVKGNGLISLAHQLVTAKLNIRYGATAPAGVLAAIAAADALIGNLIVPPVGSGFLNPSNTSALTSILDDFNNGLTGPGHCG